MLRNLMALGLLSISFQSIGGELLKDEAIPSRFLGASRTVHITRRPLTKRNQAAQRVYWRLRSWRALSFLFPPSER